MKKPYNVQFGKELQAERIENGFTSQASMAEAVNKSVKCYSKWEEGHAQPDIQSFRKICEVLETTTDQFLEKVAQRLSEQPVEQG